ncbi:hypothetical protein DQ02_09800 [Citrobacter amalonaticus]|nr:hypothetical protein DQ02_09800 [Citrobacter amalonaticus]
MRQQLFVDLHPFTLQGIDRSFYIDGMIPCPYLHYYMSDDMYRQELGEAQGEGTRGEIVKELERELFEIYRNPELAEKPKALEGRGGQYYSDAACELMTTNASSCMSIRETMVRLRACRMTVRLRSVQ